MPFRTFHSAPTESTPPKKFATPVLTISTTYSVLPCQAIPTTDVKPSMNSVHGPLVAVGSQVTLRAHGAIRQMRDVPAANGKPLSSPTYQYPSGPTATDVGTASAGNIIPGGTPNGPAASSC